MLQLFKIRAFLPYITIIFLNAMTDLGHKIILQDTIFKAYSGSELIVLTAIVNALILLPFIFLFSPSGYISDKYKKTKVIKWAALFAVFITALITLSYYMGWFWFAFILTFVLAAQSAIYAPAKYGLIKEMTGNEKLAEANAIVQAVTIVSILAGAVIYSIFFENIITGAEAHPSDYLRAVAPIGFLLIFASFIEYLLAIKLDKEFVEIKVKDKVEFDIKEYGNLNYLRANIKLLKSHRAIWLSIIGLSILWGVSQVVLAIFGDFLKDNLGITDTVVAQGLLSLTGVGIIIGSIVAGKISKNYIEMGIVPLGALGVTLSLYFLPHLESVKSLAFDLILFGVSAGLIIVPLNSVIQFAAPKEVLGRILAGNNFMQNLFMFLFLVVTALIGYFEVKSTFMFYIITTVSVFALIFVLSQLPQALIQYFVKLFIGIKYKLSVDGIDNIDPNKGILLLGNHISFLDWAILQMAYPAQIRFVMDRSYYNKWYLKPFLKFFKVIPISPRGSKSALAAVTEALNSGDTVALFPEGHITRNGHLSTFKRGFEAAAKDATNAVIVPFYLRGLWEDNFSYASKKLKRAGSKDISVSFGKPMPHTSTAKEVKKSVFDLSVKSWQDYANTLPSIQESWLKKSKEQPLRVAVADSTGVELSSNKFMAAVFLMAKKLKPLLKGQNIGIILPTSAGGYIGNMSLLTLDKTIVNLNYSAGEKSLKHALDVADIKSIVTSRLFVKKLQSKGFDLTNILELADVIYLEDLKKKIGKLESLMQLLGVKILPTWALKLLYLRCAHIDDTATILFSSGSEGTPKGIELTHKNLMGNIKQFVALVNPEDRDVIMGTLPIFHAFGLTVTTIMPLTEGITVACHPDPTDGYAIGKLCARYQGTHLFATATFYRLYARNRKINPLMFKDIKMAVAGAEKLPKDVKEAFKKRFNKEIYEGYGATETTPVASTNLPDVLMTDDFTVQIGNKEGTVGMAIPGSSFKIVEPETFEELATGEDGMILIGGTQIMKGYLKDPEKTAEVIKEIDGLKWYVTGDKGHLDEDGFLTIVDRYSRFAKLGGEMVSLGLIEREISAITDENSSIAVTAIPDAKKGERLILLLEGVLEIDELKAKIKELNLNSLFVPSRYYKVDMIPRLGSGKIDLKGLKKYAMELEEG